MVSEHYYKPVDLSLWDVCKPHVNDERLKGIELLHVFGEPNGCNAIVVTCEDNVYAASTTNQLRHCIGLDYDPAPNMLVELKGFSHQNIKCFSSGEAFTIALTKDGRVLSCGQNLYGQLGIGSMDDTSGVSLVMIPKEETVVSIQSGKTFNLALTSNEKVYVWGFTPLNGTFNIPVTLSFGQPSNTITQISCYNYNSAVLASNGDMYKRSLQLDGDFVILAKEVSTMACFADGFIYISQGKLYENNQFISDADDCVAQGDYYCFNHGQDFYKKKIGKLFRKVDVLDFQRAFANLPCPQFLRNENIWKAFNTENNASIDRIIYPLFYNNKNLSDVTIKLKDGEILYLQKQILKGFCPHFKQVFTDRSADSKSSKSELDLTSYNPMAYKTLLKYVYSGIFYRDTLTASDLIDLYNITESHFENDLKQKVLEAFKTSITIENVCKLYILADKQMPLVEECIKFGSYNIHLICKTDGYKQMEGDDAKMFVINCATRKLEI